MNLELTIFENVPHFYETINAIFIFISIPIPEFPHQPLFHNEREPHPPSFPLSRQPIWIKMLFDVAGRLDDC